jgi:hypothetical protein
MKYSIDSSENSALLRSNKPVVFVKGLGTYRVKSTAFISRQNEISYYSFQPVLEHVGIKRVVLTRQHVFDSLRMALEAYTFS